VEEPLQLKR